MPNHPANPTVPVATAAAANAAANDATTGSRAAAALFCLAFGALLIWGVGFSRAEALHDAAHDTRHSNGFPCH